MSTPQKTYLYLGVDNLTFAEYVGKRIMYFRKKKGYTGAKLANRSRTTATSISRIEKGKNIVERPIEPTSTVIEHCHDSMMVIDTMVSYMID